MIPVEGGRFSPDGCFRFRDEEAQVRYREDVELAVKPPHSKAQSVHGGGSRCLLPDKLEVLKSVG